MAQLIALRPIWSRRRPACGYWDPPFSHTALVNSRHGLFSVIIPVYNGNGCLERAVASVQGQTYQDFEILIVDDGSTDDSLQTARQLAAEDPRIIVYAIENSGGPARPRNHAIQRSRGEFIAFLDQDDWWLPQKLEHQLARFRQGDCSVVYSDAIYLDASSPESGSLITELSAHQNRFGDVPEGLPEGQVQRHLIMGNFAALLTVVVRADWVRKAGRLDESAVGVDCYEYPLRIALAGGSFGAVRGPLAVHDRGTLSRDQEMAWAHTLRFFKDFSRRFPRYRQQWTFRIREYEDALIAARIRRIRDGSQPLRQRLGSFYDVLWLHPRGSQLRWAAKSLLPPTVRRGLRAVARRAQAHAGMRRLTTWRRRRSPNPS